MRSLPRYRAGLLVETFGLPQAYANGLRFVLEGKAIWDGVVWCWCTKLTMAGRLTHCTFYEQNLRPIYDGDLPSSWDRCAWRPKDKVAA